MIRGLDGKYPIVHPSAFVSEFAYVIGDVKIGANSSIWPGVVLRSARGTMTIGQGTNIQDGSVCHADGDMSIGDYVTLGHGVICHAKVVGNHCLLGNNSTLNDKSSVGNWVIVAAGSVLLEQKVIMDNSLVAGMPARVLKQLEEKHFELIRMNADEYVKLSRIYKEQGALE